MSITKHDALDYHRQGRPGKIEVRPTKPLVTQRDLTLAYSPGVADAVLEVERDPLTVFELTAKANLVGVVSNGSAILGLGNLGPLPSKPVMEGKGVLFKRFADIDVFDIEINATTPDEIVAAVRAIAPTFGGINLEDIKAPECFEVEQRLRAELDIPVFHDDQHGTAIITGAASSASGCNASTSRWSMCMGWCMPVARSRWTSTRRASPIRPTSAPSPTPSPEPTCCWACPRVASSRPRC